jgi:recombination protein RecA
MSKKPKDGDEEPINANEILYKSIEKNFGAGVIHSGLTILSEKRHTISISPALDIITGGLRSGCFMGITGNPKTGKSVLALTIAAKAQRPEYGARNIFYVDVEHRLNPQTVSGIKGLILDSPRFNVVTSTKDKLLTAIEYFEIASNILKNQPGSVLIWDSISALADERESTEGIGSESRGSGAKLFSQWLRLNNAIVPINDCIVIGITHLISNTSGFGAQYVERAARSWSYYCDVKLKVKKSSKWDVGEKTIGLTNEWECLHSSLCPPGRTATSYIRFGLGIDDIFELQELAISLGIIRTKGAWYSYGEAKFQGSEKLYRFLQANPTIIEEIRAKLNDMAGLSSREDDAVEEAEASEGSAP